MKGPGFRLDLDVRRVWECPACGRRLKLPGGVTQVACDCRGEASAAMRLVERLRRTESPFDHVGYAAQKRIDAALRKPHGPPLPGPDEDRESVPESVVGSDADLRPPEAVLPETTHAIDADAPTRLEPTAAPSGEHGGAVGVDALGAATSESAGRPRAETGSGSARGDLPAPDQGRGPAARDAVGRPAVTPSPDPPPRSVPSPDPGSS